MVTRKLASRVALLLLGAFAAAASRPGQVQGAGSAPATVTNTPLPVLAQQQGGWNVGISGTPTVTAEQSTVWAIENRDERGRVPYSHSMRCAETDANACSVAFPPVPADMRLVIEHINSGLQLGYPANVFAFDLFVGKKRLYFPASLNVTYGGFNQYVVNEAVVVYVEAGDSAVVTINATANDVNMSVTISGYLVDLM